MESLRRTVQIALGLVVLLAPLAGRGQSEWKWLTGGDLKAVKFIGQKGWIIGDDGNQGIILHTTNGGDTWAIQPHNTGRHYFRGLSFVDSANGWIVGGDPGGSGEQSFIIRTRDGGNTWTFDSCPTRYILNGVCFVDTVHGWLTNGSDSVFKTNDGARTWVGAHISNSYFGITFKDTLRGWAAGGGYIGWTTDGGITWKDTIQYGGSGTASLIDMVDSLQGFATGAAPEVYHTTNGWRRWNVQFISTTALVYGLSVIDTATALVVGGGNNCLSMIAKTTNSGNTWRADSGYTNNFILQGVQGFLSQIGWTVGQGGVVMKTTNLGLSWRVVVNTDISTRTFTNVFFSNSQSGWAVGTYGAITHTTNGGTVWQLQKLATQPFLYGEDFPDTQNGQKGWVCGEGGLVLATSNSGTTWGPQTSNTTMPLFSIDFPDTNTLVGVAVGGYYGPFSERANAGSGAKDDTLPPPPYGPNIPKAPKWRYPWRPEWTQGKAAYRVITRTTNGGQTWTAQESNQTPLYGVCFASRSEGWACGDGGTVINSTDGGTTWTPQSTPTTRGLYGIKFRDRNRGWAVGDQGIVILTTNGGLTWTQGSNPVSQVLWGVVFVDSAHGFACGNDGVVIESRDGGRTWAKSDSSVHANLMGISAVDSQHVWTVGSFGMVLGWREAGQTGIETRGQGDKESRGKEITLGQSYPNPTREIASFEYELGKAQKVRVNIYNLTGQAVRTLVDGTETAGKHVVTWNGKDSSDKSVGSGTYFYRLEVGSREATKKMVVVK